MGVEGWACGKSKVMLKLDHVSALEERCSLLHLSAVIIQRSELEDYKCTVLCVCVCVRMWYAPQYHIHNEHDGKFKLPWKLTTKYIN